MILDTPEKVFAYYNGYVDACRTYAIWKNGQQYIGVSQQPLNERLAELQRAQDTLINTLLNKITDNIFTNPESPDLHL